jgi:CRP/FNR family transcriptional regulator, transcriptional activator FtrB
LTKISYEATVQQLHSPSARMRHSDLVQIRALPLFADVATEHFDVLVTGAFLQRFPPRTELIREGDMPDFLHIIIDGQVEVYGCLDESETGLAILGPLATFVLAAVVRDESYLTSARTLTTARILMIPAASVRAVFDKDAAFARATVRELARRYRDLVRDLKNNKLRSGTERLANYLLRQQIDAGGKRSFTLPLEKRTLASYLGMAPENLSRALAVLSEQGVIVEGSTITIKEKARLMRFARPHPLLDAPDP